MQIAVKGLTNDYAQYMRDKMSEGIKGKDLHAESLRQLSNTEVQEANAKFKSLPSNGIFERYDGRSLTIDGTRYLSFNTGLFSRHYNSTKYPEVSEMGKRNTIDTPFGEMRIALKINDNVSLYLDELSQLASFDVNADGFVGKSDIGAKNLILLGYDEDGKEIEINLLEALGGIDITQFFEYKPNAFQSDDYSQVGSPIRFESEAARRAYHNASKYNMGIATEFRPEESHQQLKKENVIDFFKSYADESGWIDFTNLDTFTKVFGEKGLDLSYRKTGADGSTRLERINFYTDIKEMRKTEEKGERFFAWQYQAARALRGGGDDFVFKSKNPFTNGYQISDSYDTLRKNLNELIKIIENGSMDLMGNGSRQSNNIANEFYQLTGMNFSESNFAILKEGLQNGGIEFLDKLSNFNGDNFNFVVGMQLDEDSGKITMLFDSGKEVTIAIEDLYSGNGELTVDENGNRASVMNEAREMSEEELNELDFDKVGAVLDERGTVVSLKELGITAIQKATYGDGRFLSFILTNADGMKFTTQDLFNMSFISSGGLDSHHKSDSTSESKSAFANVEDKDSVSTTSRMRKATPIVFPTRPVDLHV